MVWDGFTYSCYSWNELEHFPIPAPWVFLTFHCCLSVSLYLQLRSWCQILGKACSLPCWDSLCQQSFYAKQSMPRVCALVISLKMGTDNGNTGSPCTIGVLACVTSAIRILIKWDAFGLQFQAMKWKDLSLYHFWQKADFSHSAAFWVWPWRTFYFEYVF